MTEQFLRDFEACLIGSRAEKAEWVAELSAHLEQAAEAGDLEGALARLGSPKEAAAAFRSSRQLAGYSAHQVV